MNYNFGYNQALAESVQPVSHTETTGLKNEVWYLPPTIAPETEEDYGDYRQAQELIEKIDLSHGLNHWADLTGTFIFGDFVEAFFTHFNIHTATLFIDHYVLSRDNIDSLALLLNKGYVDRLEMIISDYWFRNEIHDLVPYIYAVLGGVGTQDGRSRFQLGVSRTHKKLVLFKTDKGAHVCMHGSANFRSTDAEEHLKIENNPALYNRLTPRIRRKIDAYKTINEEAYCRINDKKLNGSDLTKVLKTTKCLTRSQGWMLDQTSD